jgi:hypothetical protein
MVEMIRITKHPLLVDYTPGGDRIINLGILEDSKRI